MPQTPRGLPYPDSGGDTLLWGHFERLADAVDAALDELLGPLPGLRAQVGETSGGPTSATSFTKVVTFPEPFGGAPIFAVANIGTGAGASAQWNVRAISMSATGLTIFGYTPAATPGTWSGPLHWLAVGPR